MDLALPEVPTITQPAGQTSAGGAYSVHSQKLAGPASLESSTINELSSPKKVSRPKRSAKRKASKAEADEVADEDVIVLSEWCKAHPEHKGPDDMVEQLSKPLTEEEIAEIEKVKAGGKTPRPSNSWILYRSAFNDVAKVALHCNKQNDLSVLISRSWHREPKALHDEFMEYSRMAKARFNAKFGKVKYRPNMKTTSKKVAQVPQAVLGPKSTGRVQKSRPKQQRPSRAKGKRHEALELAVHGTVESQEYYQIPQPQAQHLAHDVPDLSYQGTPATSQVATPEPGAPSLYQGQGHDPSLYGSIPFDYNMSYQPQAAFPQQLQWPGTVPAHSTCVYPEHPQFFSINPAVSYNGVYGTPYDGTCGGGYSNWPMPGQEAPAETGYHTSEHFEEANFYSTQAPQIKPNTTILQQNIMAQQGAPQPCIDPRLLGMPASVPGANPPTPVSPSIILQDQSSYLQEESSWDIGDNCEADQIFLSAA